MKVSLQDTVDIFSDFQNMDIYKTYFINSKQLCNLRDYANFIRNIDEKIDRTKTGTHSIFGAQMRFDLSEGFPLLTSKKVAFGRIKSELLWFLRGDNNIRFLLQHHNHIWDEWPFKKWVESNEYKGPDMTDFGLRTQKDRSDP